MPLPRDGLEVSWKVFLCWMVWSSWNYGVSCSFEKICHIHYGISTNKNYLFLVDEKRIYAVSCFFGEFESVYDYVKCRANNLECDRDLSCRFELFELFFSKETSMLGILVISRIHSADAANSSPALFWNDTRAANTCGGNLEKTGPLRGPSSKVHWSINSHIHSNLFFAEPPCSSILWKS